MASFKNITGSVFNRLTALEYAGRGVFGRSMWICRCQCGNFIKTSINALTTGNTKSCGCLKHDTLKILHKTHGRSTTVEYKIWAGIIKRCMNKNATNFAFYGGRGITVCERWLYCFENFFTDMGPRPTPDYSIERKINSGSYTPENCYWATRKEQGRNRRNNHLISFHNETKTMAEWAEIKGIPYHTLKARLKYGYSAEIALNTPIGAMVPSLRLNKLIK